jgi:hypothetical protein
MLSLAHGHIQLPQCDSQSFTGVAWLRMKNHSIEGFLIALCLSAAVYVLLYFAMVRSGTVWWSAIMTGGVVSKATATAPDYRGIPEKFFRPIHYLDRMYFRRSRWGDTTLNPVNLPNLVLSSRTNLFPSNSTNLLPADIPQGSLEIK